ncbi:tRNA-specific 2-thiouridylase MnmA [hydrothermal vent metagenome]|uniref:tRNA-specific 2-thiouridylase MnmA n=1 Tax=hydrothermal vent metagenome TaxID=652676 RepID=A0A3B0TI61_9ZZZZ
MDNRIQTSLDICGTPGDTRVVVAMSGGVDSSVAAGVLARAGYDVVGLTLQLYNHGTAVRRKGACCAGQDIHDARRVADQLGIAHYVLDYEARFRDAVIDDFAASYVAGETPVPCVLCNEKVKFADLLATARELGAAAMVTGHYVASRAGTTKRNLHRAADATRDQSYFLFSTQQQQLEDLRFPLGELDKSETRRIAAELGLDIATKPDSQDICFVPQGRYRTIIEALRPEAHAPGKIVHVDGTVLGTHDGVAGFTVGQRRGLGVAASEPLFVCRINAKTRSVIVGPRAALLGRTIQLRDVNWLGDAPIAGGEEVWVKVRSGRTPAKAKLEPRPAGLHVVTDVPEEGIAPGQACVFYDRDGPMARVLGGGWIVACESDSLNPGAPVEGRKPMAASEMVGPA